MVVRLIHNDLVSFIPNSVAGNQNWVSGCLGGDEFLGVVGRKAIGMGAVV